VKQPTKILKIFLSRKARSEWTRKGKFKGKHYYIFLQMLYQARSYFIFLERELVWHTSSKSKSINALQNIKCTCPHFFFFFSFRGYISKGPLARGGVGEPNRGGCKGGCSFEKSLDVCVNLEWKIWVVMWKTLHDISFLFFSWSIIKNKFVCFVEIGL